MSAEIRKISQGIVGLMREVVGLIIDLIGFCGIEIMLIGFGLFQSASVMNSKCRRFQKIIYKRNSYFFHILLD